MSKKSAPGADPGQSRKIVSAVPDTTALRALAHPERLRMLTMLRLDGPATATGLAHRLGLKSGATSYHLRQRAEHGLVQPATDLGNKRERWWRAGHESTQFDHTHATGDELEAGLAWSQSVLSQQAVLLQKALEQIPQLSTEWREASDSSDYLLVMTADRALVLKEKISELLLEEKRNSPPLDARHPPDTKRFMVMLHSFPLPGLQNAESEEGGAT